MVKEETANCDPVTEETGEGGAWWATTWHIVKPVSEGLYKKVHLCARPRALHKRRRMELVTHCPSRKKARAGRGSRPARRGLSEQ